MAFDSIIQVLQWLIPTGSIGAVVLWVTNKTIRITRTNKEVHDTYKTMYEDIQGTLLELQNENKKLYHAVQRLEKAVSKATTCRHYDSCPLRNELQYTESSRKELPHRRQSKQRKDRTRMGTGDTTETSESEDSDGQHQ